MWKDLGNNAFEPGKDIAKDHINEGKGKLLAVKLFILAITISVISLTGAGLYALLS